MPRKVAIHYTSSVRQTELLALLQKLPAPNKVCADVMTPKVGFLVELYQRLHENRELLAKIGNVKSAFGTLVHYFTAIDFDEAKLYNAMHYFITRWKRAKKSLLACFGEECYYPAQELKLEFKPSSKRAYEEEESPRKRGRKSSKRQRRSYNQDSSDDDEDLIEENTYEREEDININIEDEKESTIIFFNDEQVRMRAFLELVAHSTEALHLLQQQERDSGHFDDDVSSFSDANSSSISSPCPSSSPSPRDREDTSSQE